MPPKKVIITQNPDKPIAPEIMATAIVEVAAAAKKLLNTRLTNRAVVLLIHDSFPKGQHSGRPTITQIKEVLEAAANLEENYLKKKTSK